MPKRWTHALLSVNWAVPLSPTVASLQSREPEANLPFLFAAYAITWAAFFAYAFFMSRRQQDLRRELDALYKMLEKQEKTTPRNPETQNQTGQHTSP